MNYFNDFELSFLSSVFFSIIVVMILTMMYVVIIKYTKNKETFSKFETFFTSCELHDEELNCYFCVGDETMKKLKINTCVEFQDFFFVNFVK